MPRLLTFLFIVCMSVFPAHAQDSRGDAPANDVGKEEVGRIKATLYIGTDGDVSKLGDNLAKLNDATRKQLSSIEKMRFKAYRTLGSDTQSVLRGYANWLSPLKPSEEILLSFDLRGRSHNDGMRIDLELWQHKRKVMKSDQILKTGKPLFILGPKWRGGTLIIAVELLENKLAK